MRVFIYPNTFENQSMAKLLVEQGKDVFVSAEKIIVLLEGSNTFDKRFEMKKLLLPQVQQPKKSWWERTKEWNAAN